MELIGFGSGDKDVTSGSLLASINSCAILLLSALGGFRMVAQREKSLSYRRAEWFDGPKGSSLENCIKQAIGVLKTIEERTISKGGQNVRVAKAEPYSRGGIHLHLTTETPGESASVVPKPPPEADAIDLGAEHPPEEGEWLDGDAFLYVQADHVCLCTTLIRDSTVSNFLRSLFKKAKLKAEASNFDLMKVADVSKLKMLHEQGVKEVELRAVLYEATALYEQRKARTTGALGAAAKHIKLITGKPHDVTQDSLSISLTVRVDGRVKKSMSVGQKTINDLAEDLLKNPAPDDDYVIVTNMGQKIRPHEILVRADALIEADGKTVSREKAWNELTIFFNGLKSSGVLEQ